MGRTLVGTQEPVRCIRHSPFRTPFIQLIPSDSDSLLKHSFLASWFSNSEINTQVALEYTMRKMDKLSKRWKGALLVPRHKMKQTREWVLQYSNSGRVSLKVKSIGHGIGKRVGVTINKHCKISKANLEAILL